MIAVRLRSTSSTTKCIMLTAVALLALVSLARTSGGVAGAQDYDYGQSQSTNAATAQQAAGESHPAHIHTGPCDPIGGIEFPLNNIGPDWLIEGTPTPGEMVGSAGAVPVQSSVTTIDASLDDLLNGERALNVHESDANIQNYIACGDLGGKRVGDTLVIGLQELNDSGYSGIAILQGNGDQTTVSVYITKAAAGGDA